MDMINVPSLSSQILQLQTRHRLLDDEIALINKTPGFDQLYVQRLKKQKMILKESIERLKDRLIPDLDAWKQTLLNQACHHSWPTWAIPKSVLLFDDPDAGAKAP